MNGGELEQMAARGSRPIHTLSALLLGLPAALAQESRPTAEPVVLVAVETDLSLRCKDGRRLRLQGVGAPAAGREQLRRRLQKLLLGPGQSLRWRAGGSGPEGAWGRIWRGDEAQDLNLGLLESGRAVLRLYGSRVTDLEALLAACRRAQMGRRGRWGGVPAPRHRKLPYLNGAVLGLHHQDKRDYHPQLDALAGAGFRQVSLLFPVFVDRVDSSVIRRDLPRTPADFRLRETIAYARNKGMAVMLLPIVLIREPGEDDWRGVLRPADEGRFWGEYETMLRHYLDLATDTGVDLFSVGSELGSLEDRKARWLRLIQTARGRFAGHLTYSANWDHAHVPQFGQALDLMGITGYFSLTKTKQPTTAQLNAAWDKVSQSLRTLSLQHGRKLLITELGYASQNGCNTDPWNYMMDRKDIDLEEQRACFAAFRRAAPKMEFLAGAYFYDVYDKGGPQDWSYSPRGKPAWKEWQAWAKRR